MSLWISFAEEDREAVIKAMEALAESLKASILRFKHDQEPGKALRVAVDTLRALRPAAERSPAPEAGATEM